MTDSNPSPKSSKPESGKLGGAPLSHRGFRELGYFVAALAGLLVLVSIIKPWSWSASKPAVVATVPAQAAPVAAPRSAAAAAPAKSEEIKAGEIKAGEIKAGDTKPATQTAEAAPAGNVNIAERKPATEKPASTPQSQLPPSPTHPLPVGPKSEAPAVPPAAPSAPVAAATTPAAQTAQATAQATVGATAKPTATEQVRTTMKIQHVKSPGGVEAWLVEEHSVPLLALRFAFDGGNSQDPAGKEGLANFMSAMLDEGAGDFDHAKFQERMEELAFKMSFEDGRDAFFGSFETLSANRDAALDMLRLAMTKPRFETEAVERIKKQLLASLTFAAKSPDKIAGQTWSETAFAGHAYGRPANGTPESVGSIGRDDLEGYRRRNFARDTLRVVAVGDIDAKQLGDILDKVFGDLGPKADLVAVPATAPTSNEKLKIVEMDVPQSVVQFGMNGLARKDPDFLPGFILNQILGGGGFASRLTEEVREKRGLAYSVYSYLQPNKNAAIFGGGVATKNEAVAQTLDVIRAEFKRMAEDGPTATEFASAKSYLTGSFPLRFDSNAKIANQLLWMLQEDMGIDYVEKRNGLIEAVTLEDVKRVAKRLLKVDDLIVTVVGKPKGLGQKS